MHNVAFGYALLAGVSMATYIIGLRLASSDVHPALGTAVITGIACFINVAVTLYLWAGGTPIAFFVESLRFLIVVGVATASVNLFTLLAYASGLRVTSSFVIGGTSTLLVRGRPRRSRPPPPRRPRRRAGRDRVRELDLVHQWLDTWAVSAWSSPA